MYDGPMETVEYIWVNIWCMLDWIIGFCHTVDHSSIQLAEHLMAQHGETKIYILEVELKMDASQTVKE